MVDIREGNGMFDAEESFNRSLMQLRMARGEPIGGMERMVWEAQQWVKANPKRVKKVGLIALGVVATVVGIAAAFKMKKR